MRSLQIIDDDMEEVGHCCPSAGRWEVGGGRSEVGADLGENENILNTHNQHLRLMSSWLSKGYTKKWVTVINAF